MTSSGEATTDPDAIDLLDRLTAHGQRIVLVRDRDRETTYVSDNATRISGWTVDEFARHLYSIVADEDLPALLTAARAVRSLAYLQRFPVDILKIDREFITGLTVDSDWKRSLAAAIISLGHSLGLRVVAEGVEEAEQATVLEMLGCDAMQGYLFAEAVPVSELPSVLNRLREARRAPG